MSRINTDGWNEDSVVLIESPLAKLHRAWMMSLLGFHRLVPDKQARILDLGCGSGPFLAYFARRGYRRLCGIEPDSALIGNIPKYVGAEVKNCPAEQIEFADSTFDVVFIYCVLHHLKDEDAYRAACAEVLRVLKPGGHIFIVEPGRYRVFLALEFASWLLGFVSKTFRALWNTMEEERPVQHHFLKNHHVVRERLLAGGVETLRDDYFLYSWIFTARKPEH
ncbi:MAG: class I SAM-dependent methyltransferase [Elusimicrobiota bacterium]